MSLARAASNATDPARAAKAPPELCAASLQLLRGVREMLVALAWTAALPILTVVGHLVPKLLRRSAEALEAVRESVRVFPDRDLEVTNPPLHGDIVRRVENVEPVPLDRATDVEHRDDRAVVVSRDAQQGPKRKHARIRGHKRAAVGKNRVAARRDAIGARPATALVRAVGGDAHAYRVGGSDRPTVELATSNETGPDPVAVGLRRARRGLKQPRSAHRSRSARGGRHEGIRQSGVGDRRTRRTHRGSPSRDAQRHKASREQKRTRSDRPRSTPARRSGGRVEVRVTIEVVVDGVHRTIRSIQNQKQRVEPHPQRGGGQANRIPLRAKSNQADLAFTIFIRIEFGEPPDAGSSCRTPSPRGGSPRTARNGPKSRHTPVERRSCLGRRLPRWAPVATSRWSPVVLPRASPGPIERRMAATVLPPTQPAEPSGSGTGG